MRRRIAVAFVFADATRGSGSTVMRGQQLARLTGDRFGDIFAVRYASTTETFKNSTLFLTKGAIASLGAAELDALKRRGNRLLFDVVDGYPPETTLDYADVLVAASIEAYLDYSRRFPTIDVVLLNHHIDPRIEALFTDRRPRRASEFTIGYFGEPLNAVLTPAIAEQIEVVPVDTSKQSSDWIASLDGFSAHYAVRASRDIDSFKPFLKGFTAAHCGANILIQESQREALHWLGDDYPYLIRSEPTEDAILDGIRRMRTGFGSKEWAEASDRMAELRARTSTDRILGELRRLLS